MIKITTLETCSSHLNVMVHLCTKCLMKDINVFYLFFLSLKLQEDLSTFDKKRIWDFNEAWINVNSFYEALPGGGGGSHVTHLNFKTSHVGVYKCLSLIVGFAVTVAIWPREAVSYRDFILRAVATFWAISLVRIYPGRASFITDVSTAFAETVA